MANKEKIMIQFQAGPRSGSETENYLLSKDRRIYASVLWPEGTAEDYGYLTMVKAIKESGVDLSRYEFFYDGRDESWFSKDASADCEVTLDIDMDDEEDDE